MKPLNSSFPILLTPILIISTLMMMSSSNWLLLWCGLEINLLTFIPLMTMSTKFQEHEAATKYFLVQALGSSIILMSSITLWSNSWPSTPSTLLLLTALILKMGMAPCHFWFPSIMSSISWMNCLILSTWQKLGPLTIMAFILNSHVTKSMMVIISSISALTGGVLGINQSKIKSIMAYSSITHMGWMTSPLIMNKPSATLTYFILYTILIMPMFLYMNILTCDTQHQLLKTLKYSPLAMNTTSLIILSLSGLPPLLGFFPKLMVLSILFPSMLALPLILISGAMLNMYFYLNLSFSMLMAYQPNYFNPNTSKSLTLSTLITTSSLMIPILLIM